MSRKPWDARLATALVRPLRRTSVSPGHLTTLRLAVGLAAVAAFAVGDPVWGHRGALLFVASNLLDHTDGELARMTGRTSRSGHVYDLAADAAVHALVFTAMGVGSRESALGSWAIPLGVVAGISVAAIFSLRVEIERRIGREGARLPEVGGFEVEDVLYLVPLVTWFEVLVPFLVAAALGAPLFAVWLVWRHGRPRG